MVFDLFNFISYLHTWFSFYLKHLVIFYLFFLLTGTTHFFLLSFNERNSEIYFLNYISIFFLIFSSFFFNFSFSFQVTHQITLNLSITHLFIHFRPHILGKKNYKLLIKIWHYPAKRSIHPKNKMTKETSRISQFHQIYPYSFLSLINHLTNIP